MKKTSWISSLGPASQLTLIAAIFFLSFVTFNILFQATTGDNYFREIIAALIGTILAAVITTMLLRSQTRGEELKERNVEVFRKKVEVYEQFLDQTLGVMEDGQLSDEEIQKLRRSIYRLSLFSSEDTIAIATNFLRAQYVQDCECDLREVITAFRRELALENVDELASWDMEAVETLLRADDPGTLAAIRSALGAFQDAVSDALTEKDRALAEPMTMTDPDGLGNSISFDLTTPAGISYGLSLDYTDDPQEPQFVEGYLDAGALPKNRKKIVLKLAHSLGFEDVEKEETPVAELLPTLMIDPEPSGGSGRVHEGRRIWTIDEFAQAVLTIERVAGSTSPAGHKAASGHS